MNIEQARFNMIEQQSRPWDVLDTAVLSLLAVVKREDFLPASVRALAFVDSEVPVGEGQMMLAPRVQARLLQDLKVQRHETVLEVGTGTGYTAALLGHRAQRVISLEKNAALAQAATDNLRRAGLNNVSVRNADGAQGLAAEGPFDAILLGGSVAKVPQVLLDQLKDGGRLIAIEGTSPTMSGVLYTRQAGAVSREVLFDTEAARLEGFSEVTTFAF